MHQADRRAGSGSIVDDAPRAGATLVAGGGKMAADGRAEKRNLELLAALFERCPVAIGVRDIDGRMIIHVEDNARGAALFGRTPEQLRGVSEASLGVPADQIERAIARFRLARSTGRPAHVELTIESATGPRTLSGNVIALDHAPEEAVRVRPR